MSFSIIRIYFFYIAFLFLCKGSSLFFIYRANILFFSFIAQIYSYYCLWIDADFSSPFFEFLAKKDFSPLISLDMELLPIVMHNWQMLTAEDSMITVTNLITTDELSKMNFVMPDVKPEVLLKNFFIK